MTQKDIRDIAAYWGTHTGNYLYRGVQWSERLIDADVLDILDKPAHVVKEAKAINFKLRLRPILSLTDEEWRVVHAALRIDYDPEDYSPPADYETLEKWLDDWFEAMTPVAIYRMGAVISYLQSIGVYVPGSIDPKYVQLINQ